MSEFVTTGSWQAKAGQEEAFAAAWTAFAVWASGWPGATTLRLGRDSADPSRFVSFGVWADAESATDAALVSVLGTSHAELTDAWLDRLEEMATDPG